MKRVVISVFIFLVVGCGTRDHRTYPVHGKVIFGDGSPMPGGTIEFRNVSQGDQPIITSGIVAEDGTFELITFGNKKGAVAGTHRVIVSPKRTPPPAVPGAKPLRRPTVDPRFLNYNTSKLEVTVSDDENNLEIRVERVK